MSPKNLPKNAFFYLFDLQNHIYTSRRATEIGMHMDWDPHSVQFENREIFTYPKYEKNLQANLFLLFGNLNLDV